MLSNTNVAIVQLPVPLSLAIRVRRIPRRQTGTWVPEHQFVLQFYVQTYVESNVWSCSKEWLTLHPKTLTLPSKTGHRSTT